MPGVPWGRGCEGCRKQKKKCDEIKPSCSRCTRLHLVCVGSGQQRYKFQEQQGFLNSSKKGPVTKISARPKNCGFAAVRVHPSSELTLLVSSLIDTIKPSTDLRYNLAWSYGGFLEDVPRRLGTNEALDASVKALICARSSFCSRREIATEALSKYSRALKILRVCLNDPIKACTSETLCAVLLLLICQGFIGVHERRWTGHGEGAAQILKARGYYNRQDDFERKLLLSLRGPVLFEGLFNNRIHFSSWEWQTLVQNEIDDVTHEGQMMRCLAQFPDLMRRGRSIRKGERGHFELVEELSALYQKLKTILSELHGRLVPIQDLVSNGALQPAVVRQVHAFYQRSYGLGLVICIISSCVLNAIDVDDTKLVLDSIYYSKEILNLAERAAMYGPLGTTYVELCCVAAWIGTTDPLIRSLVEERMSHYEQNPARGREIMPTGELERLSRHLRLLD